MMTNLTTFFKRFSIFFFVLPVTIISPFIKREKNRIIFTSFLNSRFNSNSKYLFLWFVKNVKDYDSYFVINDNKLRNNLNNEIGNYFIETNSVSGKLFALQASIWIISSAALPVGGYFMKIRRSIIHLGHGTPLKKLAFLQETVSIHKIYYMLNKTNISYSIASSEYFQPIIAKTFGLSQDKILISGQPRNDQLFIKSDFDINSFNKNKEKPSKNILYAPTWRDFSSVWLFPFKDFSLKILGDFLLENNINVFLRTHPGFEDEIDSKLLNIPNVYLFSATTYVEIMDYLNNFDLLITDYSSIYFDFLLLDRPMIFLPYDYEEYNKKIGFTVPYHDFTPGYKPSTLKDFMAAIMESFSALDKYKDERNRINNICNTLKNNNCKKFTELLYEKEILYLGACCHG
jgi:CDP-glycerol glycerophosphotransferase